MSDLIKRNFLGMPVSGDVFKEPERVDQKPVEDLAPLLQALLDDPTITEFGWTQYTPWFMDGDVCEFSVNELWVRTTAEVDTEFREYDPGYELSYSYHPSLGRERMEYNPRTFTYEDLGYEGPDEGRYKRVKALNDAIGSGDYEAALLNAFGDHAIVTVRKGGIQVDSYEHD
ncbi:hypothetical protein ACFWOT_09280 [Streptomyces sp. NPDC058440]|uniref:hypothetical protein n=1 Tax=Streptomyces sp. NPDC058440 TaxID=3346501 RepID=UPI00365B9ACF